MNKLSAVSMAMMIALCFFSPVSPAVESEHAEHGKQAPAMGGSPGAGPMHEMMQHMMAMREHRGGGHRGYAEVVLKHIDELKLSDEQIGKITRIHQNNRKPVEDLLKRVRETMKGGHDAFMDPSADEAAIRKAAQEHSAAFNELVDTALKARAAINAVLTPEQLQKLKAMKSEP